MKNNIIFVISIIAVLLLTKCGLCNNEFNKGKVQPVKNELESAKDFVDEYINLSINGKLKNPLEYWSENIVRYFDGDAFFWNIIDGYSYNLINKINNHEYKFTIRFNVKYFIEDKYIENEYKPFFSKVDKSNIEDLIVIFENNKWKVKKTYPYNRYYNIINSINIFKEYSKSKPEFKQFYIELLKYKNS
jgi:hypothetical protein